MIKRLLFILVVVSSFMVEANAQYRNYTRRSNTPKILTGLTAYAKVGPNMYFGDLVDKGRARIGWAVGADKEVLNWMTVQAEFDFGVLAGQMGKPDAYLEFNTFYYDLGLGVRFSILDAIQGYWAKRKWIPFLGVGVGAMLFNAEKKSLGSFSEYDREDPNNDWRDVSKGTQFAPFIYVSGSVTYKITQKWGVFVDLRPIIPFTDELDGHNGWRDNEGEWHGGDRDFFYTAMVGASYKFAESQWTRNSKYNRKVYIENKKIYKKNARRRLR